MNFSISSLQKQGFKKFKKKLPYETVYARHIGGHLSFCVVEHSFRKGLRLQKTWLQGVRLNSLEAVCEKFEAFMDGGSESVNFFPTFFRTFEYVSSSESREFDWSDIDCKLGRSESYYWGLLRNAELPNWATEPVSGMLAIRSIIANYASGDFVCQNLTDWLARYENLSYEVIDPFVTQEFCNWFGEAGKGVLDELR